MFEKFSFTSVQIKNYYLSSQRDFNIANKIDIPEVVFKFTYDSFLKLAIAVCAKNSLRVKSKPGHHIALINKMAELLNNKDIEIIGNEMRNKRNIDLYTGDTLISKKDAFEYRDWFKNLFFDIKNEFIF